MNDTEEKSTSSSQFPLEGVSLEMWRVMSEEVQKARRTPYPSTLNPALLEPSRSDPTSLLAPPFLLWAGDNLKREARFDEAITVYQELLTSYPDASFAGVDIAAQALEQMAVAHERLFNVHEAIGAYALLAARPTISTAWARFQMGRVAEDAGRIAEALAAYEAASQSEDAPSRSEFDMADLARRAAKRLTSKPTSTMTSVEKLASILSQALRQRNSRKLRSLPSPTHFSLGVEGGHRQFIEPAEVVDRLLKDLSCSPIRVDQAALSGHGQRRYLHTDGWEGEWFRGRVAFLLTQCTQGWEWSGVILGFATEGWLEILNPKDKRENQVLPFPIKAPWPAGEHFTAGGLSSFLQELGLLAVLSQVPVIGPALAAAALEAFACSDCGFGPRGFYYNSGPTHVGSNAYAIDFTRYKRCVPFDNVSGGTPVLAVTEGLVTMVRDYIQSGNSQIENRVEIRHVTQAAGRYISSYLHLAGPGQVPVSVGMFVRQGARLGVMNDTGTSAMDHLHFAMRTIQGDAVRPHPMDGQSLMDSDDGRCVLSSNVPFP